MSEKTRASRPIASAYYRAQAAVHRWLEPLPGSGFNLVSVTIVTLVLLSLGSLATETEAARPDTRLPASVLATVERINAFVVWVFAFEFAARFWSQGADREYRGVLGRMRFLITPLAIADMLAFLPELLAMLLLPHASGIVLRALRALRLIRLFKLARYVPAFGIVGSAVRRAWPALMAALCVAVAQVYIAALLLYFIEGDTKPKQFGSVLRALWWAVVTLTTVGYGDVYPDSVLGRCAAGLVALAGIGIVAMPTGILASAFAEEFRERYEKRLAAALEPRARSDQLSPPTAPIQQRRGDLDAPS